MSESGRPKDTIERLWKDKSGAIKPIVESKRSEDAIRTLCTASDHDSASSLKVTNVELRKKQFIREVVLTKEQFILEVNRARDCALNTGECEEFPGPYEESAKFAQTENNLGFVFESSNGVYLIVVYNVPTRQLRMVQDSQEFARELLSFPNVLRTIIQEYYQGIVGKVIECASVIDSQLSCLTETSTVEWDCLLYEYGAVTLDLQEWFYFLLSTLVISEVGVFPVICSEYAVQFPLFHLFCQLFPAGTCTPADGVSNSDSFYWLHTVQQRLLDYGVSFWSLSRAHQIEPSLFNEMISQCILILRRHNAIPWTIEWKPGGMGLFQNKNDLFSSSKHSSHLFQQGVVFGIEFIKSSAKQLNMDEINKLLSNLPGVLIKVLAVREKWNAELFQILTKHPGIAGAKPFALRCLLEQKFPSLIDRSSMPSYIVKLR